MKTLILTFALLIISFCSLAQAPEIMSYQAVIRDSGGAVVSNQNVGMQLSVLQGSPTGTVIYTETHTPLTNANGLVSLELGVGTVVSGDFTTIDWSVATHYLKTETDVAGGTNYTIIGTSQLMSVPYALYAKTSGSSTPGPQGTAGLDGNTVLNGTVEPTTEGSEGDFYINTTTYEIYGPKTGGLWGSSTSLSATSSGSSTCSSWVIPYMPYGNNNTQILYVSRVPASWTGTGTDASGDITVDAITNTGVTYNLGVIATADPSKVTKITSQVKTALESQGFTGGKVAIRITVANPENVFVFASYSVGTDRGYVDVKCIN